MNYEHKWVNANNEANPLRVKYTIEMVIFQNGQRETKEKESKEWL